MADDISDTLAASLLKKEASERSLRYSAFGLVAFAGDRKKPPSAPKPNTRFLRNLVKEADSHNTALLAKEAEESRLRLEKLRREERRRDKDGDRPRERYHRRSRSRSPDNRSRRKERSRSRSGGRRRRDRDDDGREKKRQKVGIADIDRLLQASRREKRDSDKDKDRGDTRDRERSRRDKDRSRSRDRNRDKKRRDRHRHRSRSRDGDKSRHRSRRSRSQSHSRSKSPSSSPDRKRRSRKREASRSPSASGSRSPRKQRRSASPPRSKLSRLSPFRDDDDPLAPYLAGASTRSSPEIGPALPKGRLYSGAKPRGRGLPGASAMDARFEPSYDPTLDVTPTNPEDEDDWEAALEAIRDRQKWKQQGKERLKAAGFDDEFIEAWETNTIKNESRIKWSKEKGGRDWDRGKVVDEETGEVKLKASWAS
ncbi:hypothetical protein H072_4584 [Dactylellina haptotyla CBS 200.50]|uniref:Pre-mRNA-splicing factor 38B n=1 Tax=Dactylellina haptotyla (strain CBS 200.50) TaxID=1284197 RepID=S8BPY4_DACHA|nr:hypothetical protein H072_4584 [Dactylellina haptotyla CBS 200.50]